MLHRLHRSCEQAASSCVVVSTGSIFILHTRTRMRTMHGLAASIAAAALVMAVVMSSSSSSASSSASAFVLPGGASSYSSKKPQPPSSHLVRVLRVCVWQKGHVAWPSEQSTIDQSPHPAAAGTAAAGNGGAVGGREPAGGGGADCGGRARGVRGGEVSASMYMCGEEEGIECVCKCEYGV